MSCSCFVPISMSMEDTDTLAGFPYVLVRIACYHCDRRGAYRLARLASKYGAEITSAGFAEAFDCRLPATEPAPSVSG